MFSSLKDSVFETHNEKQSNFKGQFASKTNDFLNIHV